MHRDPREDHLLLVSAGAQLPDVAVPNSTPPRSSAAPDARDGWARTALEGLPLAIHQLPELERRLVVGRFYEERPVEELARELCLTPDHAGTLLQGALRTLRVWIGI